VACQEAGVPERAGQAVSPSTATSRRHHLLLIIRNAGWLAGGRLTGDVLNLLLFIMLSRRFGPAGVGQYAYAFSIVGIAYAIASLGLEEYGVREMARRGSAEGRPLLEGLVATQLSVVAVAVAGMAGYLAVSGATAEVATIVALLAGYQLAAALARTLFVPASAEQEMGVPAVTELLSRGAAFLTALLLLVVLRFPLAGVFVAYPAAGLVFAGVAAASARRRLGALRPRFSRGLVIETASRAWPFAAADILFQLYVRADVLLLTLIIGETAAGLYATSLKFVEVGILPVTFLGVAGLPALSRLFGLDPREFATAARDLLNSTLLVGGLVAWGLAFIAPSLMVPLLGESFAPAARVVRIMAALALLRAGGATPLRMLLAGHLQVTRLRMFAYATGLNLSLNLILIPLLGVPGAVTAAIVSLFFLDLLYLRSLRGTPGYGMVKATFLRFLVPVAAGLAGGLLVERVSAPAWAPAGVSLLAYLGLATAMGFVPIRRREKATALADSR